MSTDVIPLTILSGIYVLYVYWSAIIKFIQWLQGVPHRHDGQVCGQDEWRQASEGWGTGTPQGLQATDHFLPSQCHGRLSAKLKTSE